MKKQWLPILAPKIFQNAVLGETFVYEPEQMVGKGIIKNLMHLTNDAKRQNINVKFRIANVQNGKAFTDVLGYYMVQSSVRRLVRRNIEKISMSFSCKTSDNKDLQIKPLLITRAATTGSVASKIRKNTQDFLIKYIGSISYDNFINDLVNHKLQSSLKRDMSKIYPLRVCEIRSMEIIDLEKKEQAKSKAKADKNIKDVEKDKAAKKETKAEEKKEESEATEKKETKAEESKETEKKEEKSAETKEIKETVKKPEQTS